MLGLNPGLLRLPVPPACHSCLSLLLVSFLASLPVPLILPILSSCPSCHLSLAWLFQTPISPTSVSPACHSCLSLHSFQPALSACLFLPICPLPCLTIPNTCLACLPLLPVLSRYRIIISIRYLLFRWIHGWKYVANLYTYLTVQSNKQSS
jgi:hypothetical protein